MFSGEEEVTKHLAWGVWPRVTLLSNDEELWAAWKTKLKPLPAKIRNGLCVDDDNSELCTCLSSPYTTRTL